MKKTILSNCLSLICYTALATADPPSTTANNNDTTWCDNAPRSLRITARHIENKGIGYRTGYTTLETFLAAPPDRWCVMPFLDLRGHLFNDGKWAANGGIGLRNIMQDRVYGIYSYYDYRNTRRASYNQVSFGVETLGTFWDARLNGYVVLGPQKSHHYRTQFAKFSGHSLYYSTRVEHALSGANGEVGFHPLKMKNIDVYTAIGPYYLKGPSGGCIWGFETRAQASWKDYIAAEVNYSYDPVFSNIVQGQISLSYPLGPKSKVKADHNLSCKDNKLLYRRMVQPVMKEEIIPVHTRKQVKKAINPETDAPWVFWFVDNTSHSAGTFESPFPTLLLAQEASSPNQAIYVFPGDNSTTGMDNGIILQDSQRFLGASFVQQIPTTVGTISVPAMASTPPNITGNYVVGLANNNTVSGFNITAATNTNGLNGTAISNLFANQNTFISSGGGRGIALENCSGLAVLENNIFSGGDSGILLISNSDLTLNSIANTFMNTNYGFNVDGLNNVLNVVDSTFNNLNAHALFIFFGAKIDTLNLTNSIISHCNLGINNFATIETLNVSGNTFSHLTSDSIGNGGTINTFYLTGNTCDHTSSGVLNNGGLIGNLNASKNVFSNLNFGILNNNGSLSSLYTTGNTFSNVSIALGANSVPTLYVANSIFNNLNSTGQGISYTPPANANATATIRSNLFTPGNSPSAGYAVNITVNQAASSLCLDFVRNTAPSQTQTGAAAYSFSESGGDAFNRTHRSNDNLNTGGFVFSGTINPPGSCS